MRVILMALMLGVTSLAGCSSMAKIKEVASYSYEKFNELKVLYDKGQITLAEYKTQLAELRTEMASIRLTAEAAHGALDSDNDGEVSLGERTRFVGSVTKGAAMGNQEDKERLLSWEFWLMIAVGGPTATGGAVLAAKKFKKTFMNSANGNGTG